MTIWGGAHHGEANAGNFLEGFYADGDGASSTAFAGKAPVITIVKVQISAINFFMLFLTPLASLFLQLLQH